MELLTPEHIVIMERLLIAAVLSGAIGLEREKQKQPAGFRTHMLVGMSASLMMLLSITGFEAFLTSRFEGYIQIDPSRIPSYVISGIGFLGAGTIIIHRGSVRGLTTAASIWTAAGIGLVIGNGMYFAGVLATVISILALYFLGKLEGKLFANTLPNKIFIVAENRDKTLSLLVDSLTENGLKVTEFAVEHIESYDGKPLSNFEFSFEAISPEQKVNAAEQLQQLAIVRKVIV